MTFSLWEVVVVGIGMANLGFVFGCWWLVSHPSRRYSTAEQGQQDPPTPWPYL